VKNWGTIFHVVPDLKLFEKGSKLQFSDVMQWAKVTSYLNAGFHINITGPNGKTREFYAENGVADYMAEQVADLKATELGDHFLYASKEMDVAISFTDCEGMQLHGYTNGLHNPAGGLHVQNVLKAFSAVVNTYRMSKHEFKPSDLYEGLVGIVNFKIAAPAFNNQVKEKLIDERVVAPSYEQTVEALTTWFKKHKDLARILCDRATELRNLNDEFANNKKLQRELKGVRGRSALPPKLSVARCEPGQRELFLVEGDSAGGSGSKARDSNYQELLPLRGKVLNAYKVKTTDLLWSNNEILNILKSIGFNPEVKDKLAALRVGKIILLGDADKDGFHINLLNLGLLCRVIPEIFEAGMVYVAKGFEYMIDNDKQNYYGNSVTEIKEAAPANLHKSIQHLKGWAECSARGLKHMAFDPETRVLQHVQIGPDCLSRVKGLLGHDTDVRKTLIETN
jgi:DNA gyrase/topoisomerase IV subunit B